jgi:hypothetical protein
VRTQLISLIGSVRLRRKASTSLREHATAARVAAPWDQLFEHLGIGRRLAVATPAISSGLGDRLNRDKLSL